MAERLDHQHAREIAGLQVRIRGLERAGRRWLAGALAVRVALGLLLDRLGR